MPDSKSLEATEALGAKDAVKPRVTLENIKDSIAAEYHFSAGKAIALLEMPALDALDYFSICILVMKNGFVVIGKSAPASPENFDAEKGRTFAYEDAIRQLWPLMGFALRERLSANERC